MKLPFVKWIATPEGTWTMLRLLTAIVMLIVALRLPLTDNVSMYIVYAVGIIGFIIMFKSALLFLRQPEFKTMADGKPTGKFYQGSIYKYVRHPFYTGFWLVMLSLTLCHIYLSIVLLFVLYTFLTWMAAREEEKRLLKIFPFRYFTYRRRTPQFLTWRIIGFINALFTR
jgi:protein-S-isoprenylcysteine O-methyltransferase Ste14